MWEKQTVLSPGGMVQWLHSQLMSAGAQADSLGRLSALIAVTMGDFQW